MTEHEPEPDVVPRKVVLYALGVAFVMVVLSFVAVWVLAHHELIGGGESQNVERSNVPPSTPFDVFTPKERRRAEQHAALDHWQWVDAAHTRVRMPVETAIDQAVRR